MLSSHSTNTKYNDPKMKLMHFFQINILALDQQQASVSNDVHINRSDGSVILNSAISSTNHISTNSHDISNDNQDSESKIGKN